MAQIHWLNAVSADFSTAADWTGGQVPGSGDDAVLDASGAAFTVTASTVQSVASIQTAANATLVIAAPAFTAASGTGSGANAGQIVIGDNASLFAGGTLFNSGQIAIASSGDVTSLILTGTGVTLSGGGKISLSDNGANTIDAQQAGTTLENVDNKIKGVGQIGSSNLSILNDAAGIIKGNGALALVLTGAGITNQGAIKDAANSALIISSTTVNNAGGAIKAKDGATLSLQNAVIEGGTLAASGTGVIETTSAGATLDGTSTTLTNTGTFLAPDNTILTLAGAIANSGTLELSANLGSVAVTINNVTLSGGGHVTLSDSGGNSIIGANPASTLTNLDNTIAGAGLLGGGQMNLVNGAAGVIDASGSASNLVIDTGANAVTNGGLIEATGGGTAEGKVKSAVVNNGVLEANGGKLTIKGAVSGSGAAVIVSGKLVFGGAFSQNVAFTGSSGTLVLSQSQSYGGTISGFSLTGGTRLDLRDIAFVGAGEASFSGNSSSGTLTVTDGVHTASIVLAGDYTASSFVASSDGAGGTFVVDPQSSGRFVQAMAALGARGAGLGERLADLRPQLHVALLASARLS